MVKVVVDLSPEAYRSILSISLESGKPIHVIVREAVESGVKKPRREHVNKYRKVKK